MIDTVKFQVNFSLKHRKSSNWTSKTFLKDGKIESHRFTHKPSGLTVTWFRSHTYVEASLPKLLFDTNARLITSQNQIEKALALADSIIGEIGTLFSPSIRRFVRVDLAWQIQGRIDDVILALFQFKYPHIQKPTSIYMSETILWHSKKMSIKVYDKLRELNKWRTRNGDILRIEVTLRKKRLQEDFNVPSLRELKFDACYRVLRAAVLELCPISLPKIDKQLDIYQLAAKYHWKVGEKPALQYLTQGLNPNYKRGLLAKVADAALKSYQIDLRKQFPPNKPHKVFRRGDISYSMPPSRLANFISAFNQHRKSK